MNKVLIVDDSATMRKIITRVLRQAEIPCTTVLEAGNGIEGMAKLQSDPDIELILSDINMPEMNGVDFVKAIRASFAGCPGNNPIDWIAVYPFTAGTPTLPIPGSTLWKYLNNSHVGTAAPTSGTVTLDRAALGRGPWPLPAGEYTAYYLLNDQYRVVDAVDFRVTP